MAALPQVWINPSLDNAVSTLTASWSHKARPVVLHSSTYVQTSHVQDYHQDRFTMLLFHICPKLLTCKINVFLRNLLLLTFKSRLHPDKITENDDNFRKQTIVCICLYSTSSEILILIFHNSSISWRVI